MKELLSKLKNIADKSNLIFLPEFFHLSIEHEAAAFLNLLEKGVFITDDIWHQLKELIRTRNPTRTFKDEEYTSEIEIYIAGTPIEKYGVWVYYPWSNRMVHLLDREEYIELRTSRNKYKITDEEEAILATKIIGVVGLSVGQSVTLTLCMERSLGEIRIADFDTLEITNLNRIRSGVHNLGLYKTIIVAREIAEIDPFIKVTPYIDGLNSENMDRFFTEGGKMDLVIDECDGLDIKILLRNKAKALQIPVVMEASDRGVLDVERFDLEPERPLLHGFIDHLDASKIGSLTNEEKLPFILPMLGLETISGRLKASMAEIGQTIVTWPQLASAVTLGGAICADVSRRILLNQYNESGRYFVDIEELVGNKEKNIEGSYDTIIQYATPLVREEMLNTIKKLNLPSANIPQEILNEVVSAAAMAPSAGNNQPWIWISKDGRIYLFHNREKSVSWSDQDDFISNIGFGAALENARIKAASIGYKLTSDLYPLGKEKNLVAVIDLINNRYLITTENIGLAAQISLRLTNRNYGNAIPTDDALLTNIKNAGVNSENVQVSFTTDRKQIEEIGRIIGIAESIRFLHPQAHYEFFQTELKWNDTRNEVIHEGLDIQTLEMPLKDEVGLKVASDPRVIALINKWSTGKVFQKTPRAQVLSASAIGLITIPSFEYSFFIEGGMCMENIWLHSGLNKLALHPMSAPLFLHTKITQSKNHGMSDLAISGIQNIYNELSDIFPELKSSQGVFLFRLSQAAAVTTRSLRLPIDQIYTAL